MIKDRKMVGIVIGLLVIVLSGLAIAYSVFQTTVVASVNSVTQRTLEVQIVAGTITGQIDSNISGLVSCGTATATATQISGVSPVLSSAGDKCSYTFIVRNQGTLPGKILSIVIASPSGTSCTKTGSTMICGNITYKLHYNTASSTSLVAVNDTIDAMSGSTPGTRTVVLTIEATNATTPTEDFTQSGFSYTIQYGV